MPAKQRSCQGCEHHLAMRGVPQSDYQGEQHFCTFNGPPLDSNRPGEWLGFLPFPSSQCLGPLEVFGVALRLGQKLLEKSQLTASEMTALVIRARRDNGKSQLMTRLRLLVGRKEPWLSINARESIRTVLSEMDAIELAQDVPVPDVPKVEAVPVAPAPERKNPENEGRDSKRQEHTNSGKTGTPSGGNHSKPAAAVHGGKSAVPGGNGSGPTATGERDAKGDPRRPETK